MSSQQKVVLFTNLCLILLFKCHSQEETTRRLIQPLVLENDGIDQCPSAVERGNVLADISNQVQSILSTFVASEGTFSSEVPTADPSMYTCNGTPGWRQVVFINMTDTSYDCPPGLNPTSYSKRTCGRANSELVSCSSTTFNVGGSDYSRVCGRIRGYQFGETSAFSYYAPFQIPVTIDGHYADGITLTHGAVGDREHIWTFAAGLTEGDPGTTYEQCPCDAVDAESTPPFFVGSDYFCESGLKSPSDYYSWDGPTFVEEPLWDGQGCTSTSTCCQFNNPPWFTKNLPNPTTDDIELRL